MTGWVVLEVSSMGWFEVGKIVVVQNCAPGTMVPLEFDVVLALANVNVG